MNHEHARSNLEVGIVGRARPLTPHKWPPETAVAMTYQRELEIVPDAIRDFVELHRIGPKKRRAVAR